jgi:membrane protease YdiL (CAAX protease family)
MSCINLKNGLYLPASLPVSVLMMLQLAVAGYVEEIIFRGFLFRGLAKDNLKTAIVISAVTFGLGHIVNLANTEDRLGVLLQVCYAIVIGFLYTVLAYKGGSLFPCIASHMFVNATSVLGREEGPFSDLVVRLLGSSNTGAEQACSAVLIIIISGSYALWLWRKTEYTTGTKSDFNHKESQ